MFLSTKASGARRWCGVAIANTRSTRSIGHELISLFAIVAEDFLEAPENDTALTFYMGFCRTCKCLRSIDSQCCWRRRASSVSGAREAVYELTRIRAGSYCY
jgi:hypothetical protein